MTLFICGIGMVGVSFLAKKESRDKKRFFVFGILLAIAGLVEWIAFNGL